jgi:tetratricopeptide (TPR) repeat protein
MNMLRKLLAGLRGGEAQSIARAHALRESGRQDEALRLCQGILAARPDHAAALHCVGVIALEQGRFADAIISLERCARVSGADPQVQYDLAEALRLGHRWEAAGAAYGSVLGARPDFAAAHLGLADCLLAQQQVADAGKHCARALQIEPDNARALMQAAELGLRGHVIDGIEDAIRAALDRSTGKDEWRHALAKVLIGQQRLMEAAQPLRDALPACGEEAQHTLVRLTEAAARQGLRLQPGGVPAIRSGAGGAQPLISVIICSIDPAKYAAVTANYAQLLAGERHEIIGLHDARSLAEAYNRGAARAAGDIVIFSHDDIEILTPDFAARLKRHLAVHDVVGACGTSKMTSGHWMGAGWPHLRGLVVHQYPSGGPNAGMYRALVFDTLAEDASGGLQGLDGMFIAVRRPVLETCRFDEDRFDGFHLYDLDFTYSAYLAGLDVAVFRDISMLHYTAGDAPGYQQAFERYYHRFEDKYGSRILRQPPPERHCFSALFQDKDQASLFCHELMAFRRSSLQRG